MTYAVIFEAEINPGKTDAYLATAAKMRSSAEKISGFISVERFTSITTEGKLVSLSFWESEEAITEWRNQIEHRAAQKKGKESLLKNYRLRVAKVERDYGPSDRDEAPNDSQ